MNLKAVFSILKRTIAESTKGWIWKWLLNSVGAFCAILLIGKNFFNLTVGFSVILGLILIAGLLSLRFLMIGIKNSFKYLHDLYQESFFGDAIILLKDAFAKINHFRKSENLKRHQQPGDYEFSDVNFMETMIFLCNSLKEIFNKRNGKKFSVSIKVPLSGHVNESTALQNLCRDPEHNARDTELYKSTKHTIIGNTPFRKITNSILNGDRKKFHYINNDIERTEDYDNSSKECHPNGILPYKSELVYPIVPQIWQDNKSYECHGFICLDCDQKNGFQSKYDVAMIQGVADGIYDILSWRSQQKKITNV
jgi:hypothetical protein